MYVCLYLRTHVSALAFSLKPHSGKTLSSCSQFPGWQRPCNAVWCTDKCCSSQQFCQVLDLSVSNVSPPGLVSFLHPLYPSLSRCTNYSPTRPTNRRSIRLWRSTFSFFFQWNSCQPSQWRRLAPWLLSHLMRVTLWSVKPKATHNQCECNSAQGTSATITVHNFHSPLGDFTGLYTVLMAYMSYMIHAISYLLCPQLGSWLVS